MPWFDLEAPLPGDDEIFSVFWPGAQQLRLPGRQTLPEREGAFISQGDSMSGKKSRWTDAALDAAEGLIQEVGREEAAKRLGVAWSALKSAFRDNGRPYPGGDREKMRERLPADPGTAPWQGYKPHTPINQKATPKGAKVAAKPAVTVVMADLHVPHHDARALGCALGLIRELKPDRVVINGDFMDMESLSRHPKSRPDLSKLAAEFYSANLVLDSIQHAAGSAEVYLLEGNHCHRAVRFACEFGQLDGMLSVPVGLYIEAREDYHRASTDLRGVHWVPLHMQPFAIGAVSFLHGVYESIHHAYQHAWQLGPRCSTKVLIGAHMHAFQAATSNAGFTAYSCPWLGDGSAHVFGYTKGRPRPWSHGVMVVEEHGDVVTVSPVPIQNGVAVYGGRVVAA